MIFEYVLVVPQDIKVLPSSFEGEKLKTSAGQTSEPTDNLAALLRVNKQTLKETRVILYRRNTFRFSTGIVEGLNASALTDFVNSVAKVDLACIQRIVLSPYLPRGDWSVRRRGTDFELESMAQVVAQKLTGVEEVKINLDGPYGPPARRCPAVVMERKSDNLRKVARVARILKKRGKKGVTLRAGRWLDLEFIKGQLKMYELWSQVLACRNTSHEVSRPERMLQSLSLDVNTPH
jgi:hypothetical protein